MSKELIAILALTMTLITALVSAVFSYGRLSERVDTQTNAHLIGYVQLHRER